MNNDIDIIIPWVDGKDPKWRAEKNKYSNIDTGDDVRYQSWDNLHLLFRAIEVNMPWVRRVFLVTSGHLPSWLNINCERLEIVFHKDYIPEEYLPTFNSNTIEMNYHRIEKLSENYILFNDDLFPILPIPEEYYFIDNMPCEEAVETHFILKAEKGMDLQMNYACVNNMVIINRNFEKREVVKKNREKWFSPIYGDRVEQNRSLEYWNNFESFVYPHEAMPMKKSVLSEIWDKEKEALHKGSCNKFRSFSDVTQRLITIWQICSGEFVPHKYKGKLYLLDNTNYMEIAEEIRNKKYQMVSLNEKETVGFETIKRTINSVLEEIFPNKSEFEL